MRKAVAIFLLAFLPLQWGWAAAAVYCQHEAAADGGHFGHHEHAHSGPAAPADAVTADFSSTEAEEDSAGLHADCGMCQLSSATAVFSLVSLAIEAAAESVPRTEALAWLDSHPESLYRPPLTAAA